MRLDRLGACSRAPPSRTLGAPRVRALVPSYEVDRDVASDGAREPDAGVRSPVGVTAAREMSGGQRLRRARQRARPLPGDIAETALEASP